MARRRPDLGAWARLSARIIHDPDFLAASGDARLLFLTSIALAKNVNRDGLISLRAMVGIQHGVMTEAEVTEAAHELIGLGLWTPGGAAGTYCVRQFTKWNETAEEMETAALRKRVGALKTNHALGRHQDKREADCPDCAPVNAQANAHGHASDRYRPDKTRQDKTRTPPPPLADPSEADALAVVVGDELIRRLGYVEKRSTVPERRYVAKALKRGWHPDQLYELAADILASDIPEDPRRYLLGALRIRANAPPGRSSDSASNWSADWVLVSRAASQGCSNWLGRDDLSLRARQAAHAARQAIRFGDKGDAKWAFRDAYNAVQELPA